ncbi:MAG: hypothetical protein ABR582_16765, partial [Gemmatimonadaceae bacterium]
MRYALLTTTLIFTALACSPEKTTTPSARRAAVSPAAAKPVDSRANWIFADSVNVAAAGSPAQWSPAGLRGDGRLKNGEAST